MSSIPIRSFTAGEIAPALYGRADTTLYQKGLRTCLNFYVMRHGGVTNRPGTAFIAEAKDNTKTPRLIKFVFNADQTYVLVFGEGTMRVVKNGAQLTVSPAAWNMATAYVVGNLVSRLGVNYYCILAHTNQQPPNATYWYPMPSNILEVPTPYASSHLRDLQYVQSADVVTLVHPSYAPREVRRTGDTAWSLVTPTFAPTIAAPTGINVTGGPAGSKSISYVVTAVATETYEESLQSSTGTINSVGDPTPSNPINVSWSAVAGAQEYNVYRQKDGVFGFIGIASGTSFSDTGYTPDKTESPPIARNPFSGSGDFPSTVTYYQQRLMFANTDNNPEKGWASRTGNYQNFTISSPLQDDDSVTFTLAGRQVNEIRHLLDVGGLVALTAGGEWVIKGDSDGVLLPTAINARQQGYTGAAVVAPVLIGNNALFVQSRGSILRDLRFEFTSDGYTGNDLTVGSSHLVEGRSILALDYQQNPHSIAWMILDNGVLLSLTYMREQEVKGWARHTTDGSFEDVCVVPEGEDDAVYVVVKRTINGTTKRYIERFKTRRIETFNTDAWFVDSGLTYNGVNTTATTMTLSGGTTWEYTETLTLTASTSYFVAGDVGNEIVMGFSGEKLRCMITVYTSGTQVSVIPVRTVPVALRNTATTDWSKAVDELSGLSHLEGKSLSVLADGYVVSNGIDTPLYTVTSGAVTLDRPYSQIIVGLPYNSDVETLDIDPLGELYIRDTKKQIRSVTVYVEESRGIFAGGSSTNLFEFKQRDDETYSEPIDPLTGPAEIHIQATWNDTGRVFIRQSDPLPLTILSIVPEGQIGG